MKLRTSIAVGLVCTTISLGMPRRAAAQQSAIDVTSVAPGAALPTGISSMGRITASSLIDARNALAVTGASRLLSMPSVSVARMSPFAPTPGEIRLSRGAKTAIIVSAIVVGVLLIVGVVVISGPRRPL